MINAANENATLRKVLEKTLDLDQRAHLPQFHADTLRRREKNHVPAAVEVKAAGPTVGRAALFATCYCNVNTPDIGAGPDQGVRAQRHTRVRLTAKEECCGMPKLEQGDLETVDKYRKNQYSRTGAADG